MRLLTAVVMALCLILAAQAAFAEREIRSISTPCVSADGETVFFSCWGDIWSAPRNGSAPARRLTDNVAHDSRPMLSPDGTQIAFISDRFGNSDLFLMPVAGGPATQLTWDDTSDQHYDWTPDGSAILEYAVRQDQWGYALYEVPIDGGQPRRVTGPDHDDHLHGTYIPGTDKLVYSRGPARWAQKRYRGSANYDIWTYDLKTGQHEELTNFEGKDIWPQPTPDGKHIYFVSDRDGTENFWVMDLATKKCRQVTHFKGDGPRWPRMSEDGDEIACEVFGELYIVPTDGGRPEHVPVTIADDPKHELEITRDFRDEIGEFALSPNGKYFAVTVLGDIYLLKNPEAYEEDAEPDQDTSRTRPLVISPGRERDLSWHNSSTKLAYISDRDGQYDLYILDLVKLEETRITDTPVDEGMPVFAPKGDHIVYYSGNREMRLYNTESGADVLLHEGTVRWGPWPEGFSWAPDGYWLVYLEDILDYQQELFLINIEDREPVNVTEAMDWNGAPGFTPDGKYLVYSHSDDFGADVMLLELNPEEPTYDLDVLFPEDIPAEDEPAVEDDEEVAEDDDTAAGEGGEDEGEAAGEEDAEPGYDPYAELEPLTIQLDRIQKRSRGITRFEGSAYPLAVDPDSKFILFNTDHSGGKELWSYEVDGGGLERIGDYGEWDYFQYDPDGTKLYYLDGSRVAYLNMSGGKGSGSGSVRFTSRMDYNQVRIWEEVLTEGWRVLDQGFYDANMGGLDWDEVLDRYLPRVKDCCTPIEFSNLYTEMLGELGRSHLWYSSGEHTREAPGNSTARIGVWWDEAYDGPGWRVTSVLNDGPATVPGAELYPGDVVLAINDEEIPDGANRARLLTNVVGHPLKLEVRNGEAALAVLREQAAAAAAETEDEGEVEPEEPGETREVVVRPTSSGGQRSLRYAQWVEDTRAMVYDLSDDRIGYQHIERMYDYATEIFRRELFTESYSKDALIIDVRFNGGGSSAVDVLRLINEPPTYLRARRDDPVKKFGRQYVWQGPVVVLCNAHSFSNAEIFAHIMKDAGLATVIGEPTPGGVISTSSTTLVDGSTCSIPSGGNWRLNGEDMETNGCIPDIIVLIDPQAVVEGRDNQIEAAVDYLLKELAKK